MYIFETRFVGQHVDLFFQAINTARYKFWFYSVGFSLSKTTINERSTTNEIGIYYRYYIRTIIILRRVRIIRTSIYKRLKQNVK